VSELLDLLHARDGIVCATGAGGKKSVLFALAARHPGRVAFTTTVHTLPPPEALGAVVIIAPEQQLEAELHGHAEARFIAYACPGDKPGRLTGVPTARIDALHAACGFDLTLVKADGARMRWVKAPADDEPVLPAHMTTLIPVLSARALGEPLGSASPIGSSALPKSAALPSACRFCRHTPRACSPANTGCSRAPAAPASCR
jgi:probable selenium-dependent hydroxylase accessory protein YqeC